MTIYFHAARNMGYKNRKHMCMVTSYQPPFSHNLPETNAPDQDGFL